MVWEMIKSWFIKAEVKGRMEVAEELADAAVFMFKEASDQIVEANILLGEKIGDNTTQVQVLKDEIVAMESKYENNGKLLAKLKEFTQ